MTCGWSSSYMWLISVSLFFSLLFVFCGMHWCLWMGRRLVLESMHVYVCIWSWSDELLLVNSPNCSPVYVLSLSLPLESKILKLGYSSQIVCFRNSLSYMFWDYRGPPGLVRGYIEVSDPNSGPHTFFTYQHISTASGINYF